MKVSFKTFMPLAAVGMLSLASCETVNDRAQKYMSETNRTQLELEELTQGEDENTVQSRLDSLAYRDIFNSTQAAKDSAHVAEFNKIAATMRPKVQGDKWDKIAANDRRMVKEGSSRKELEEIKDKDSMFKTDPKRVLIRQHYADDWAYRKFFSKIGIMNDSIADKCDEVSKKIRP